MRVKDLSIEERPREKLLQAGEKNLSNAELLALVLRQGSRKNSVIELANEILKEHNLRKLSRIKITKLKGIEGIGLAKASQIVACFELGRRLAAQPKEKKKTINSAKDVARLLQAKMETLEQEECRALYLDARKRVLKEETIFIGSLDSSIIHPREIFKNAILEKAAGIILVHNHPSGDPTPSEEDILITKQLKDAGELLGITLLDHIIIGQKSYCSVLQD